MLAVDNALSRSSPRAAQTFPANQTYRFRQLNVCDGGAVCQGSAPAWHSPAGAGSKIFIALPLNCLNALVAFDLLGGFAAPSGLLNEIGSKWFRSDLFSQ
jgi:hypothetical protein